MTSKPIDPMCPMREVSNEEFTAFYWELEDNDRYFHHGFMRNCAMVAIWNWSEGSWWYCETISILVQAAVAGAERLESLGIKVWG